MVSQPPGVPPLNEPFPLDRYNLEGAIDLFVRLGTLQHSARIFRQIRGCYHELGRAARELAIRMEGERVAHIHEDMPPRLERAASALRKAWNALSGPPSLTGPLIACPPTTLSSLLGRSLFAVFEGFDIARAEPADLSRLAVDCGRIADGIDQVSGPVVAAGRGRRMGKALNGGRTPDLAWDVLLEWAQLRGVNDRALAEGLAVRGLLPTPGGGWELGRWDGRNGDDPVLVWASRIAMEKQRIRRSGRPGGWKVTLSVSRR